MHNLIFAFMQAYGEDDRESLLLARSLRTFAGRLAEAPIWMMVPQKLNHLSDTTRQSLEALGVRLVPFAVSGDALKFPFGGKVFAAAAAETHAQGKTEVLVWMDSDTVCVQEPAEFLLPTGISLGYRPVMLKNISSLFDEPLDRFWKLVYKGCNTPAGRVFSMQTSVDGTVIRPQFNAGLLVARPERALLRAWRDNFGRLYLEPGWGEFYKKHILYYFFIHQAILSATLLGQLEKEEMLCLGEMVNYPLFLHSRIALANQAVTMNQVVTFRYDAFNFFDDPKWKEILPVSGPLLNCIETQNG